MQSVITMTIPNPLATLLKNLQMRRAVRKWNADAQWIEAQCKTDEDRFKWSQLVWQEIWMWISLGERKRPRQEMEWLCKRRGFNSAQQAYLERMMKHVWMWG